MNQKSMNQKPITIEEAWVSYQHQLLSFIRLKVATDEDAEELLSDVFVKLTKAVNGKNTPDNISAWLYRVTKNSIVDYYRTRKNHEELSESAYEAKEEETVIKQLSHCMLPMIKALPETYQHPLILSEIEGKKYKEVATTLGLSLPAVKSRILRGREKLHKSILSCCTVQHNKAGEAVDYEKNKGSSCSGC